MRHPTTEAIDGERNASWCTAKKDNNKQLMPNENTNIDYVVHTAYTSLPLRYRPIMRLYDYALMAG